AGSQFQRRKVQPRKLPVWTGGGGLLERFDGSIALPALEIGQAIEEAQVGVVALKFESQLDCIDDLPRVAVGFKNQLADDRCPGLGAAIVFDVGKSRCGLCG